MNLENTIVVIMWHHREYLAMVARILIAVSYKKYGMSEEESQLSREDIERLLKDPSPEARIEMIDKLSSHYNKNDFTESQVDMAQQIFRLLLREAETAVRQSLANNLTANKDVPKDIILALARDVEEVALPVLEFSEVLTDDDLVEIIQSSEEVSRYLAIAGRKNVSNKVSGALIETKNEEAVGHLLHNDGAEISDSNFDRVVDSFSDNERIVDSMITRGTLSQNVISRMTDKVSNSIQRRLEQKYQIEFGEINDVFQESGEVAALKFMGMQQVDKELMDFVNYLEKNGSLDKSLESGYGMLNQLLDGIDQLGTFTPISALVCGNLTLFCISLSRLTGLPFSNVKTLVSDTDGGLAALYERAGLPNKFSEAVGAVVDVIKNMQDEHEETGATTPTEDPYRMVNKLIEYSKENKTPNLPHFVSMIQNHVEASKSRW